MNLSRGEVASLGTACCAGDGSWWGPDDTGKTVAQGAGVSVSDAQKASSSAASTATSSAISSVQAPASHHCLDDLKNPYTILR